MKVVLVVVVLEVVVVMLVVVVVVVNKKRSTTFTFITTTMNTTKHKDKYVSLTITATLKQPSPSTLLHHHCQYHTILIISIKTHPTHL